MTAVMCNFEKRDAGKDRLGVFLVEPEFPIAPLGIAGKQQLLAAKLNNVTKLVLFLA